MSSSEKLFEAAQKHIPGGVNSPVRAFKGVGGTPIFFENAKGAYIFDVDGKKYIDYVGSWGPMILGHQDEDVIKSILNAVEKGVSFGAPTTGEIELASLICEMVPSVEQVRLVNSGTEATMTAIRLARAATNRDIIIKFEGCYHGHSDSLLVKAGSGALTLGQPSSPGVPNDLAKLTLTLSFNNISQLEQVFTQHANKIAGVIIEPVPGNMGCILPDRNFLVRLRALTQEQGTCLIFDEVMSGFRVAQDGAQGLFDIKPDLTTFGKIMGGGMPVGAIGGKKELMSQLAPVGPVYQAGTLSGNPISVQAGIATLKKLKDLTFYDKLREKTEFLVNGFTDAAKEANIPLCINWLPGMFGLFFTTQNKVTTFSDVMNCNVERYKKFFHGMLEQGIYFAPSAFESGFVSIAHNDESLSHTLHAAKKVFAKL
jgi:glutamate-1-semialdehyde 2,1-aminomutase